MADALDTLIVGALIDGGAAIDPSLGERGLVLDYHGERVEPEAIVAAAMEGEAGADRLRDWAQRLCEAEASAERAS